MRAVTQLLTILTISISTITLQRVTLTYTVEQQTVTHNMQHALDYGTRLLMMDGGEIILDIDKEEKANLTMDDIIEKFHAIKKKSLVSDRMLLQ